MRGASGDDADENDEPPAEVEKPSCEDGPSNRESAATEQPAADGANAGDVPGGDRQDVDAADDRVDEDGDARSTDEIGDGAAQGELDASEIDASALTVSERSLHPRIRILWVVRAVLWSLVLGAIAAAITWQYLEVTLLAPAAVAAVILVLFVAHAILRYRAWQYEFREDAIYLERGVLTRVRTVVPFVRIQHVDTARGPVERAAGLSTLVVYTAGSRGADVTIPGIEAERATDHQRRLKQLAIAAEDDTAV